VRREILLWSLDTQEVVELSEWAGDGDIGEITDLETVGGGDARNNCKAELALICKA